MYHIRARYSILRDVESEAYAPPRESAAIQMGLYWGGKVARTQRVTSIQPNLDAVGNKVSRPYDGMAPFSEQHKQLATQLLATAATLERGYQAFLGSGNLQVVQSQVNEMDKLHQQWLSDLESFKSSLRAQGAEPMALEYVNEAFGRLAERIKKLAG